MTQKRISAHLPDAIVSAENADSPKPGFSSVQIAERLAEAVATLDYSLGWLDGDPDAFADIGSVIRELSELRRELETAPSGQVPP